MSTFSFNGKLEMENLTDAIITDLIETTYASVPAGSSWANYIPKTGWYKEGYQFLGILGWKGDIRFLVSQWTINSNDQMVVTILNASGTAITNETLQMYGLYVKK